MSEKPKNDPNGLHETTGGKRRPTTPTANTPGDNAPRGHTPPHQTHRQANNNTAPAPGRAHSKGRESMRGVRPMEARPGRSGRPTIDDQGSEVVGRPTRGEPASMSLEPPPSQVCVGEKATPTRAAG